MKLFLTVLLAMMLLVPALHAELPVWIEGAGYLTIDDPLNLSIEGNVLIDVVKNFQVRANLVNLNLTNGTALYISSGSNLDALLHFPGKGKFSFYGVGGFSLNTREGSTAFAIQGGLGALMSSSKKMKPFIEALVNFYTSSYGGDSNSDVSFAVRGGIRFR